MWVLPDRTIVPLPDWHFRWALANQEFLKTRYGISFDGLTEEQPVRLHAVNCGMTRINHEHSDGKFTIECNKRFWVPELRCLLYWLVTENTGCIDWLAVNVLNDEALVTEQYLIRLFDLDDAEREQQIRNVFIAAETEESEAASSAQPAPYERLPFHISHVWHHM